MKQLKYKKIKFYKVKNELFKAPLSLFIGNVDEYNKKIKELGYNDNAVFATGNGKFWSQDNFCVMWINDLSNKGLIIHELSHYCFYVMNRKGIPINVENDEVFAYMIEYMFNKLSKLK